MGMSGKFDVLMSGALVHDMKEIAAAQRRHLLRRRLTPVVAVDAAHEPRAEKHVGALKKHGLGSGLDRRYRRRAASPTAANYHDLYLIHVNMPPCDNYFNSSMKSSA